MQTFKQMLAPTIVAHFSNSPHQYISDFKADSSLTPGKCVPLLTFIFHPVPSLFSLFSLSLSLSFSLSCYLASLFSSCFVTACSSAFVPVSSNWRTPKSFVIQWSVSAVASSSVCCNKSSKEINNFFAVFCPSFKVDSKLFCRVCFKFSAFCSGVFSVCRVFVGVCREGWDCWRSRVFDVLDARFDSLSLWSESCSDLFVYPNLTEFLGGYPSSKEH